MPTTSEFPALERQGYAGKKLGRFEVMAKLGVGGMSEVFLAWQKAVGGFQRPVVLKRILAALVAALLLTATAPRLALRESESRHDH